MLWSLGDKQASENDSSPKQGEVEVHQLSVSHWDTTPLPKLHVPTVNIWQQEFAKFLHSLSQRPFPIKIG